MKPLSYKSIGFAALGIIALALPLPASAAENTGTVPTAQEYVEKAAIGDMFEIMSSELAMERTQNDEVRDFAEMMVEDHQKSSEMIKEAVAESDAALTIPTAMDSEHEGMLEMLREASATEFDQMYLEMQSMAHQSALNLHAGYAENGDDEALRDAAEDIAPVIEEHVRHLQEMGS